MRIILSGVVFTTKFLRRAAPIMVIRLREAGESTSVCSAFLYDDARLCVRAAALLQVFASIGSKMYGEIEECSSY